MYRLYLFWVARSLKTHLKTITANLREIGYVNFCMQRGEEALNGIFVLVFIDVGPEDSFKSTNMNCVEFMGR